MEVTLEKGKQKILKVIYGRTIVFFLTLILQIILLVFFLGKFAEYLAYYYGVGIIVSIVTIIFILNRDVNPAYKLAWSVSVAIFPVFGALFYLYVQIQTGRKVLNYRLSMIAKDTEKYQKQDENVLKELEEQDIHVKKFTDYMNRVGNFNMCEDSDATYFALGDDWYDDFLVKLKDAKDFVFIEFFIVGLGKMWTEIFEVLKEKVKQGVEVRILYDGTCSLFRLPKEFPKYLASQGIECRVFSPTRPVLSTYQNNRDHRKIVVIDGKVAYTGGVNLADEYINHEKRFGHWKDTAVRLEGNVVDSFTVLFLQNWNIYNSKTEDMSRYIKNSRVKSDGYIMAFTDSPFDEELVGETVYMDILNTATKYVHIMTPYLILDNEMITALSYAVKRGVDVKIITPHIPDKKYAYILARNNYEILIKKGVKIYEYTPGFIHAKQFVSDDEKAVVGSINLDYRSLYLNFECAAYLYRINAICDAEKDFQETLAKCQEITWEDCKAYSPYKRFLGKCLWFISPLM